MAGSFLHIQIDKNLKLSLSRQVYEKIRDDILMGSLQPETRLPATRRLAKELEISRNVVMGAYDQLHAEGYIESSSGSYTRVADDTHYRQYRKTPKEIKILDVEGSSCDIEFKTGVPDLALFPRTLWGKYLKNAVKFARKEELTYDQPNGHEGFRKVLADYLYKSRGIRVLPSQIVITSGATQALFLTAKILYTDGCDAVLEDPGGYGVIEILKTAGFGLNPVKTNGTGFDISRMHFTRNTRLVYVTPSHQFPMGYTMPAATRIGLLKRLQDRDIYIVEDDYDSEFRYDGSPIHPLKALDPDRVIYIGSFSKVLSPALRIGYAVVPEKLIGRFSKLKQFSDAQSPLIDQIALKNFIQDGAFENHVYKMKKSYQKKRNILISTLKETFGSGVKIYGENAGIHIVAGFENRCFDLNGKLELCHNRVRIQSVEKHVINKGDHTHQLIFGYGNLTREEIVDGINKLNRFISVPGCS